MLRWICLVCFVAMSVRGRNSDFSHEEAMKILDKHNELRTLVVPSAANMEIMVRNGIYCIVKFSCTISSCHGVAGILEMGRSIGKHGTGMGG